MVVANLREEVIQGSSIGLFNKWLTVLKNKLDAYLLSLFHY